MSRRVRKVVCCSVAVSSLWLSAVTAALVKWRPNTSFNLALNFQDGKRPCSRQTVHFPNSLVTAVQISSTNDLTSLVLPIDGELLLGEDATINFGPKPNVGGEKSEESCVEEDTYYLEKSSLRWIQADAWESGKFTAATPDAQRMPCFDDDALFPEDSQFSIKLPDITQYVRSMTIGGVEVDRARFKEIAESSSEQSQSFILNNALSLGVVIEPKSCQSRAGCPCQENATIVDCSLKACDVPKCYNPVLPEGNCCPICGGVFKFEINVNTFDFMSFMKIVDRIIIENGGPETIIHHVGLLSKDQIQVVMVDRGDYEGNSAMAVHVLGRELGGKFVSAFSRAVIGASPLSLVGISLLIVALVTAGLYVWFQRPDLVPAIPRPRLLAQTSSVFSRFDNRVGSITSLASRGSVAFGSSFRNPLYSSTRGKGPGTTSLSDAEVSASQSDEAGALPAEKSKVALDAESFTRMSLIPDLE